jgi:acyl-coenzyme A synthetase/AMP-(fatty) acid ligase
LLTTPKLARELAAGPGASAIQPIWTVEPAAGGRGLAALLSGAVAESTIPVVSADDLAAVFFTSGSTGDPKGVMWSQACLARTMRWVKERSAMNEEDRLISLASLQYTTALDIFAPLETGAKVHLLSDREAQFPDRVLACVRQEGVTIWSSSATVLRLMLESGYLSGEGLEALRRVEFFGEPFAISQLRQLMAALPQAQFVNIYGATEAYDMVSYVVPRPLPSEMAALPLGQASRGSRVMLCEESGVPVAAGAVGEICVRSDRVMLGYWNDPVLTHARRLEGRTDSYRSGDLAFRDKDGLLRLVGRKDNVTKLRGHRFDLGEIETVLKSHPSVRDAIAVASPTAMDAAEILAAILTDRIESLEVELKRFCRDQLPSFACPVRFLAFDRFPLLPSGKVDRRAVEHEVRMHS